MANEPGQAGFKIHRAKPSAQLVYSQVRSRAGLIAGADSPKNNMEEEEKKAWSVGLDLGLGHSLRLGQGLK